MNAIFSIIIDGCSRLQDVSRLDKLQVTLVIGQYAQAYHLPEQGESVTEAVKNWRVTWPHTVALPHPSPRNNQWLKRNPWFEKQLLPELRSRIQEVLATQ